jgi:L-fuconolactonase
METGRETDVVDAHVHFWDPAGLEYPWLENVPELRRAFVPRDYAAWSADVPVRKIVFVECNPRPDQALAEVEFVQRLSTLDPRIAGIVAYLDLLDVERRAHSLDALGDLPLVKGVRHNIQGNPAGFCLQPAFVAGVREVGARGLTFDLCAEHNQLAEVVALARQTAETRLVLDHCGKPGIRAGLREPWETHIRELAALPHVWCKLSGLMTEADPEGWSDEEVRPYAAQVVRHFGVERVIYGSDWPVATLAARSRRWYPLIRSFTESWGEAERRAFFWGNAHRFYHL